MAVPRMEGDLLVLPLTFQAFPFNQKALGAFGLPDVEASPSRLTVLQLNTCSADGLIHWHAREYCANARVLT